MKKMSYISNTNLKSLASKGHVKITVEKGGKASNRDLLAQSQT